MSLRILALTNLYPSVLQPGRAPFNRQLFRAVAERCAVHVISPIAWTDEVRIRLKSGTRLGDRRIVCNGISVDHPRYVFPPKFLRRWHGHFYRWSVKAAFERALDEFRPNVIYGSWAYPDGWAAVELGHRAGLPVIVRVHGSDIYLLDRYPDRLKCTREALSRAEAVVTPSSDLARRVVELGADPKHVHVIYNGVDVRLFHFGSQSEARRRLDLPPDQRIVLFVGNLVALKGVNSLIDACGTLAGTIDFHCYLIGDGPMWGQLQNRIRDRGLAQYVTIIGQKPHQGLPDWYRAADVFVLPSHSEGVPNVLLEAMASGTRFVASDVGGIPEISQMGRGTLITPGDVSALAAAIHQALEESNTHDRKLPVAPKSFAEAGAELIGVLEQVVRCRGANQAAFNDAGTVQVGTR